MSYHSYAVGGRGGVKPYKPGFLTLGTLYMHRESDHDTCTDHRACLRAAKTRTRYHTWLASAEVTVVRVAICAGKKAGISLECRRAMQRLAVTSQLTVQGSWTNVNPLLEHLY